MSQLNVEFLRSIEKEIRERAEDAGVFRNLWTIWADAIDSALPEHPVIELTPEVREAIMLGLSLLRREGSKNPTLGGGIIKALVPGTYRRAAAVLRGLLK